jgi:hypothetical protein
MNTGRRRPTRTWQSRCFKFHERVAAPRLRLSCRFADWLGSTDLELFKDYCGTGSYAVLALEPLDHQEALAILADQGASQPEVFLAEATARRMAWQTQNPQKC